MAQETHTLLSWDLDRLKNIPFECRVAVANYIVSPNNPDFDLAGLLSVSKALLKRLDHQTLELYRVKDTMDGKSAFSKA